MKRLALAIVPIGAALVLAHMHAGSQIYHPVVKVSAPDGMSYTALLPATRGRPACGEAYRRFLEPLEANCADCEVTLARCERELEGFESKLQLGLPVAQPVMAASGVRIAVEGAARDARRACERIAGDIARRGVRAASCASPMPGGRKS